MSKLVASVIIATYNKPKYLDLVLHSYSIQTIKDFEIIVADDGSDVSTKHVVEAFSKTSGLNIKHVWHTDKGFRKTKILNKAIVASSSDYLIFTDDDCIARKDFVETHLRLRNPNQALSGGYFKLTKDVSKAIDKNTINNQYCFDKAWLLAKGQPRSFKMNKLSKNKLKIDFLNRFTTTKATFDGMNVSCWKQLIEAVNGFDERMQYGGLDREVGERLMNLGVKFKQIRYLAICLHLYHKRPYKSEESLAINKNIRKQTKRDKIVKTAFGIDKNE